MNTEKLARIERDIRQEIGALRMERDETMAGHGDRDRLARKEFLLMDAAESVRKALGIK